MAAKKSTSRQPATVVLLQDSPTAAANDHGNRPSAPATEAEFTLTFEQQAKLARLAGEEIDRLAEATQLLLVDDAEMRPDEAIMALMDRARTVASVVSSFGSNNLSLLLERDDVLVGIRWAERVLNPQTETEA